MKPGYKTSEFYVTLATVVGTLVTAIAGGLSPTAGASVAGGLAVAYSVGRVVVKVAAAFFSASGTK